jgi:hypothetical protein
LLTKALDLSSRLKRPVRLPIESEDAAEVARAA